MTAERSSDQWMTYDSYMKFVQRTRAPTARWHSVMHFRPMPTSPRWTSNDSNKGSGSSTYFGSDDFRKSFANYTMSGDQSQMEEESKRCTRMTRLTNMEFGDGKRDSYQMPIKVPLSTFRETEYYSPYGMNTNYSSYASEKELGINPNMYYQTFATLGRDIRLPWADQELDSHEEYKILMEPWAEQESTNDCEERMERIQRPSPPSPMAQGEDELVKEDGEPVIKTKYLGTYWMRFGDSDMDMDGFAKRIIGRQGRTLKKIGRLAKGARLHLRGRGSSPNAPNDEDLHLRIVTPSTKSYRIAIDCANEILAKAKAEHFRCTGHEVTITLEERTNGSELKPQPAY